MADDSDFYVEAIVYNAHIMRRLVALGMKTKERASVAQLLKKMGYLSISDRSGDQLEIRNLIGLRLRPIEDDQSWRPLALDIAKTLDIDPDKLWPGALKYQVPKSASKILHGKVSEIISWLII